MRRTRRRTTRCHQQFSEIIIRQTHRWSLRLLDAMVVVRHFLQFCRPPFWKIGFYAFYARVSAEVFYLRSTHENTK